MFTPRRKCTYCRLEKLTQRTSYVIVTLFRCTMQAAGFQNSINQLFTIQESTNNNIIAHLHNVI